MKKIAIIFIAATMSAYAANSSESLLKELGTSLSKARALPMGTKTVLHCPENLEQLMGISISAVKAALSKPNYERDNAHTYFFTSPIPPGQRGGGFPQLTFFSNKAGTVERVTCAYSR